MINQYFSRRRALQTASCGFGWLALSHLAQSVSAESQADDASFRLPARAKNVILCYMSGGVSHVDSFDPKPRLEREAGKPMPMKVERTQFNNNGNIFPCPFSFKQWGESGIPISSMFPHIAESADELAVIRSMTTTVNEHAQGNFAFHTGFPFIGHPSSGAWINYGLGTENENVPGYVVLKSGQSGVPHGGVGQWSSGYLPAEHQASIVDLDSEEPVPNIQPRELDDVQRRRMALIAEFDGKFSGRVQHNAQVEAAIRNYETAYRMQSAVPELCDLSQESESIHDLYGTRSSNTQTAGYARQCLLARRLVERGVRFVELTCLPQVPGGSQAPNPWDQHGGLEEGHRRMAQQVDQPIGGLLKDLKSRGLLDSTLVIWAGEFGRTPFSQGSNGRDHNPFGFSVWMAGGGIRGGVVHGATDEYGYHVIENKQTFYDLWATVLHQLGVDHEQLTFRYSGRDMRLTDVHGNVIQSVIS
ncbi:hypothetical protein KOR42_02300 [Thalassoglobus neptunius]|uniref:Sulfatase n=1 Tax=Thalassoglobus neptunius TaxID=1938619 RepID=A0A5C5X3W5_9PLAN|nr:DUF1501 domain-containing protein [Thalassoglobus neptunius]TWT56875.1 hypothetical protein KOR42_02300 [Thalassoglobus neptunius]